MSELAICTYRERPAITAIKGLLQGEFAAYIDFSVDEFSSVRRPTLRLPIARSSMRPFRTARLPIATAQMAKNPTAVAPMATPTMAAPMSAEEADDFTDLVMKVIVKLVQMAVAETRVKYRAYLH